MNRNHRRMAFLAIGLVTCLMSAYAQQQKYGPCADDADAECPDCGATESIYFCSPAGEAPQGYNVGQICANDNQQPACSTTTYSCGDSYYCMNHQMIEGGCSGIACKSP